MGVRNLSHSVNPEDRQPDKKISPKAPLPNDPDKIRSQVDSAENALIRRELKRKWVRISIKICQKPIIPPPKENPRRIHSPGVVIETKDRAVECVQIVFTTVIPGVEHPNIARLTTDQNGALPHHTHAQNAPVHEVDALHLDGRIDEAQPRHLRFFRVAASDPQFHLSAAVSLK